MTTLSSSVSLEERLALLRDRNTASAQQHVSKSAAGEALSGVLIDPSTTSGWKLRRAALLRAYCPASAPAPQASAALSQDATKESSALTVATSTALTVLTSSLASGDDQQSARRRQREEEPGSNAIIPINADLLREQTRREQEHGGVASSTAQQQPHWKMAKVLTGHRGWVRCVAFDPANEWFCTGSNDTVIKVWDLSTGAAKVNLISHKEAVRGVAVSEHSPYLYSCGDDHAVKGWDLERNEVIRDFHGHGSAVYAVSAHPVLDVIVSASRDKTVRVWDVRSRTCVHTLTGHSGPVLSLASQSTSPQIISGGDDGFIYLWDLGAGKALTRLTRHRKPVRAVVPHHAEQALISAGADNIRKWKLPLGDFITNMNLGTAPRAQGVNTTNPIWTCCAISKRNTVAVGSESGELALLDWGSHSLFQSAKTKALPGATEAERGILCCAFDISGSRLVTGELDKTVKIWNRKESN